MDEHRHSERGRRGFDFYHPAHAFTLKTLLKTRLLSHKINMSHVFNLMGMFGIEEAMDALCDTAHIDRIDWQRMTDETIAEIGKDCAECSCEAKQSSNRCHAC